MTDKEKKDAYEKASDEALQARRHMVSLNNFRIAHPESNDYLVRYIAARAEYERLREIANNAFFDLHGVK